MSSFLDACRAWLRNTLGWSDSAESWQQCLGGVALPASIVLLSGWPETLSLIVQILFALLLFAAIAAVIISGLVKLCGPVLFYDLLCVGRRNRYYLLRVAYTVFLSLILSLLCGYWYLKHIDEGGVPVNRMSEFTESFFFTFALTQFALVIVLTPAYVGGAVAEEKDRKTLEFLLATDLRNHEIVLSKLVSRIANLGLIILAGLPILGFTQFLGGIDPNLVMAAFALTGLTLVSLASLSIFFSVHARRPRDSIVLTYLVVLLYPTFGLVTWAMFEVLQSQIRRYGMPEVPFGLVRDFVGFISQILNSGNLVFLLIDFVRRGGSAGDTLLKILAGYALFHSVVTLVCTVTAVARLRVVALKEPEQKTESRKLFVAARPRIGDEPMIWKEVHSEPKLRLGILGRIVIGVLMLCSYIPPVIILVFERGRWMSEEMNVWVRLVGTPVACLMLLAVAVRAAGSISGERDRQTLDALLTSPLETRTILFGKWLGSILSVRWAWLWLGSIWGLGLLCGGINPCAIPLVFTAWVIYAGVFAVVGLWFSLVCKTTLRATISTLLSVVFIGGGHWILLGTCCWIPFLMLMEWMKARPRELSEFLAFFQLGQTPPFVMGLLAFHGKELDHIHSEERQIIFCTMLGLVTWMIGGLLLYGLVNVRFRRQTSRDRT
jgi:ABC-type transport system involved in multi-copper enzyme maturation permease subunit